MSPSRNTAKRELRTGRSQAELGIEGIAAWDRRNVQKNAGVRRNSCAEIGSFCELQGRSGAFRSASATTFPVCRMVRAHCRSGTGICLQEHFMSRLRRLNSSCQLSSAAAEVLELRALLSSGAGAVHAAQQHAALQTQAGAPHAIHTTATVGIAIDKNGAEFFPVPARVTVSTLSPIVGSHVTLKVSLPHLFPGTKHDSLTATLSGTVQEINPSGIGQTQFVVSATGDRLTLKTQGLDGPVTEKAIPLAGGEWQFLVQNGAFLSAITNFQFAPTAPPGVAGHFVQLIVGPL
jgi:hypothetical protein